MHFYQKRILAKDKETLDENGVIKSCTDCKITKTPLWRVGPTGPKSLCNACGIKYRKRKDGLLWGIKDRYKEKYQRRNKINTTTSCVNNDDDVQRREDAKLRQELRANRAKMLIKDEKVCENKMKESGCGEMGEKLKVTVMELGKELVVLQRKPRSPTKTRRRRSDKKRLGEVEEAAVVLMAMSCG